MNEVRLPDLQTIKRFSIAVRREHAPAEEVIEALRADLKALENSTRSAARRPAATEAAPVPETASAAESRSTGKGAGKQERRSRAPAAGSREPARASRRQPARNSTAKLAKPAKRAKPAKASPRSSANKAAKPASPKRAR